MMEAGKLLYILSVSKKIDVQGWLQGGVFKAKLTEPYGNKPVLEIDIPLFGNVDTKPFEKWLN